MLHVNTLGKLEVRSDEGALEALVAQPKRVTLFLYLVLSRPHRFHRRDALLALFWPALNARRARSALNQALSFLRRELGDGVVSTRGPEEVAVDHLALTCDAIAFEEAVEAKRWDEAFALYKGDLLPGLHVGGTEVDRWLDPERDRLRAMAAGVGRALALQTLLEGKVAVAESLGRRALQLAPTDEEGARSLIEALARAGYRAAALRLYRLLGESLAQEFELEPSYETQRLATSVRNGVFEVAVPEVILGGVESNGPRPASLPYRNVTEFAVDGVPPAPTARRWTRVGNAGAAIVLLGGLAWAVLRSAPPPEVSRYEIEFAPGQEPLDEVRPTMSLSSDGSFIAYVGPGDGSREATSTVRVDGVGTSSSRLWIKRRDDFQATPLEGTDGARTPSVSPDGTWIAYVAGNRLRKIPVGGGASLALADSVVVDVPAWLDDGTIVYTDSSWRLRRVPAMGGKAEVLWTPPDSLYAGSPVSLPGSRGLLFVLCDWYCKGSVDYWVLDLRTGEVHRPVKGAIWAAYASTGDLVYARRDGSVYAAPFDVRALKTTGSEVPVLHGVKVDVDLTTGPFPDIDLSADGTLLYRTGVPLGREFEFVWTTRDGVATPVSPGVTFDPGNKGNFGWSLSPDGTRVAFRRLTNEGDDIWIEGPHGTLSRLTDYPGVDRAPRWSPDGAYVTFVSRRDGNMGVWAKRADGVGEAKRLFDAGRHLSQGFWTPDGKRLVMRTSAVADSAGDRDILVARPGVDSVARPLIASPSIEAAPAISPDSRWIAYDAYEDGVSEVVVRPFPDVDGGNSVISTAPDGGVVPLWAHNGHELFYVTLKRDLVSVRFETGRTFRVVSRHVLFHLGQQYYWESITGAYDIAPDDQRFLLVRQAGAGEQGTTRTMLVEHWTEDLKKKMRG